MKAKTIKKVLAVAMAAVGFAAFAAPAVTDSFATKSNTSYTKTIDTKTLFGSARRDAKRMPTSAEIQALIDNCDRKSTTLSGPLRRIRTRSKRGT